ncbi:MAG: CAP domain-containing protein [Desulfofustis sp.]|nr:CAP domain-containing protein [Desulfofustis sp.]
MAELRDLPGGCLNEQETELVELINAYRGQNGLSPIEASRSLTMVGHWHVIDLETNAPAQGTCNMHSWSGAEPQLWSAVCYTADHANAAGMWSKPNEITNGVYYSHGYENAAWSSGQISAAQAFNLWKNSPGHNAVILELGIWQGKNWQAMGVGISQHYAVVWFGQPADPHGEVGLCD